MIYPPVWLKASYLDGMLMLEYTGGGNWIGVFQKVFFCVKTGMSTNTAISTNTNTTVYQEYCTYACKYICTSALSWSVYIWYIYIWMCIYLCINACIYETHLSPATPLPSLSFSLPPPFINIWQIAPSLGGAFESMTSAIPTFHNVTSWNKMPATVGYTYVYAWVYI